MSSRWLLLAVLGTFWSGRALGQEVSIEVDAATELQPVEGFGASTLSLADCGIDLLGDTRSDVLNALYGDVRLTMGDVHLMPYEAIETTGCGWAEQTRQNDNDDPMVFNWSAFDWWRSDPAKEKLIDPAMALGFDNFSLRGGVSSRWADTWLNDIRASDYQLYLQEAAENAVAILVKWRDDYGIVPRWHQLFNEPLSGNNEVWGGSTQEIVDLVKTVGARLRTEGFDDIMLVVPSEETVVKSTETATAILADADARQYVGAIGYHTYPYGSAYAKASNILAASGAGQPPADEIAHRTALHDLAAQYGVQVWMTEVSHSEAAEWDTFRARAIQIHDELRYAQASSYWAMFNVHTELDGEDMVVVSDGNTFRITGMGRAIGHYARFSQRGDHVVSSSSENPLLQVTAFLHSSNDSPSLSLVLINNDSVAHTAKADISGVSLGTGAIVEQSTNAGFWQAGPEPALEAQGLSLELPPTSVTSISVNLEGGTSTGAGGAGASGGTSGGSGGSAKAGASPGGNSAGGVGGTPGIGGTSSTSLGGANAAASDNGSPEGCGCRAVGQGQNALNAFYCLAAGLLVFGRRRMRRC